MWIHFLDELRQFLHCIPHLEVGVPEVHLIADSPQKQRRMVLVLQNLGLQLLNLATDCIRIVVIHTRALGSDIQPQGHGHAVLSSRIEQINSARAPDPNGIRPR